LKVNKVNLFVSSVLFVFWYRSPNFLDTPLNTYSRFHPFHSPRRSLERVHVQLYSVLDLGTRRGWGVSVTPRPLYTPGKDPVPIVQEVSWAPGPVWTCAENLAPTGIRSTDRPARSQPVAILTELPGPCKTKVLYKIFIEVDPLLGIITKINLGFTQRNIPHLFNIDQYSS
jgi:hypothetical protein